MLQDVSITFILQKKITDRSFNSLFFYLSTLLDFGISDERFFHAFGINSHTLELRPVVFCWKITVGANHRNFFDANLALSCNDEFPPFSVA